jgi:phytanoyl-CoA hydroxylase
MNTQEMNTQELSARDYYETNGYVVFKQLIPLELIDSLLKVYQRDIVTSKHPFFRQNTNVYEQNNLNEFGYVKQSFLDIHDYAKYPDFSAIARDIYCSNEIQNALKQLTNSESLNLMQTMLFDANTETPPHQDWWYLDTVPNGHLTAAWIALEDIDERAGRFYVLPKSTDVNLHSDNPNLSHSEWLERVKSYVDTNKNEIKAPELKKGDVLFWNSRTVHGSLPTIDTKFSRKSITAHYIPCGYKFGNLFTTKDFINYKTYKGVKFYRNQPDYSLLNKLKFGIKVRVYDSPVLLKMMRIIQGWLS